MLVKLEKQIDVNVSDEEVTLYNPHDFVMIDSSTFEIYLDGDAIVIFNSSLAEQRIPYCSINFKSISNSYDIDKLMVHALNIISAHINHKFCSETDSIYELLKRYLFTASQEIKK